MDRIKLVTYNIHKGFGVGNINFLVHEMRAALEQLDADLICLQEIQGKNTKKEERVSAWPTKPQSDFLAEHLWPYFAYGQNASYRHGHHGNAILSKFPFEQWENIDVSKHRRASRGLLHALINIPGSTASLHLICIHFALFKTERKRQLDLLELRINQFVRSDEPLIIAGDFNDWRGKAEEFLVNKLNLKEVFVSFYGRHAKTFPAWHPILPVDRIYFRNVELLTCKRLSDMPWKKLSDHVPLYAEFRPEVLRNIP